MKTIRKPPHVVRWGAVAMCLIFALIAAFSLSVGPAAWARPDDSERPIPHAPAASHRKFMGLPDAKTVVVQQLLPDSAVVTTTFALTNGTPVQMRTVSLPAESMQIFTSTTDFAGLGRVEVEERPELSIPAFALNYSLAAPGNGAYLGPEWYPAESCIMTCRVFLPLVTDSTEFTLQNRNVTYTVNVVLSIYNQNGGSVLTGNFTLPPGGAETYNIRDLIIGLPAGFVGSAVVSSDQPVAVASVRLSFGGLPNLQGTYPGLSADDASTMLVAPALFNAADLQTSMLCVQNTDSRSETVNVTYTDGVTNSSLIQANGTHCFNQSSEPHVTGWSGGAVITSTLSPLLAVVDVIAYDGGMPIGEWAYAVPPQARLNQTIAFPLLNNNQAGWTSQVYLFNSDILTTTVTLRSVGESGFVQCLQPVTIPPKSAVSVPQAGLFNATSMGFFTSTQPGVAAAIGFTSDASPGTTDRHFGYEAAYFGSYTPQRPCGTLHEVFLPAIMR